MVNNKKGFTLIELMIVVAIIGILAAVAIPAYSDYTRKAKISEITNFMGAALSGLNTYVADNGENDAMATAVGVLNTCGVDMPTKYISAVAITACSAPSVTATITCTVNGAEIPGVTGTFTLEGLAGGAGTRTWGGTAPSKYRPRN